MGVRPQLPTVLTLFVHPAFSSSCPLRASNELNGRKDQGLLRGMVRFVKRRLSIGLAVVLLLAVVAVVIWGRRDGGSSAGDLTTVRGVIGSEKQAFFTDQRVVDAFAKHGLKVEVDTAGSRQIATTVDLGKYEFAFPSSSPAAQKIQRDRKVTTVYTPFQSPMAV